MNGGGGRKYPEILEYCQKACHRHFRHLILKMISMNGKISSFTSNFRHRKSDENHSPFLPLLQHGENGESGEKLLPFLPCRKFGKWRMANTPPAIL
jgi:hypothetical protein